MVGAVSRKTVFDLLTELIKRPGARPTVDHAEIALSEMVALLNHRTNLDRKPRSHASARVGGRFGSTAKTD